MKSFKSYMEESLQSTHKMILKVIEKEGWGSGSQISVEFGGTPGNKTSYTYKFGGGIELRYDGKTLSAKSSRQKLKIYDATEKGVKQALKRFD